MSRTPRRWLITGVSSGLGAALAQAVLDHGDAVVGTVRSEDAARAFASLSPAAGGPGRAEPIRLDVTDRDRVFSALEGQTFDVLVNNAGYCLAGAVETLEASAFRDQLETNVVGALNMIQAVLPGMRAAGSGRIINIGSLSGVTGMAGLGGYCASKFALAGLSDTLAAEVSRFGVLVTLVEPGGFRTNFAGRSLKLEGRDIDDYAEQNAALVTGFARSHGHQPNDPAKGARALIALAEHPQPPIRFALGHDARERIERALAERIEGYRGTANLGMDTAFS
ncbi:SDR family NAD(P)-dependent oxidoreductase [Brevundimonas sp.]|uniref:SDR family NAD(P)-dependent oxidoreductase n=1 Tax=Brevundimonas sp. TaxID=1871086 RepID=UPI003BA97ACC